MMTRILLLATLMATGCITAESHEPSPNSNEQAGTVSPLDVTEQELIGRWVARASGEIHDLRPNGVWAHVPAAAVHSASSTGTWRIQEFGGEHYLVTIYGGTGAQRIIGVDATTLELAPGGVYDLITEAR